MDLAVPMFYIYIIFGVTALLSNAFFAYAILRRSILRQRYRIILVQVISNGANGAGLLLAGLGRLILNYIGYTRLLSRRICILTPWNLFFTWSEPMVSISLLLVSIDRFFAVCAPLLYYRKNHTIGAAVICIGVTSVFIGVCIIYYESWQSTERIVGPFCWTSESQTPSVDQCRLLIIIGASVLSVLLYIVVFVVARIRFRKDNVTPSAVVVFKRRQETLTATMCVSCILTTILFVVPMLARYLRHSSEVFSDFITYYSPISTNINPFVILVTIYLMQEDVREAVRTSIPKCLHPILLKSRTCPEVANLVDSVKLTQRQSFRI